LLPFDLSDISCTFTIDFHLLLSAADMDVSSSAGYSLCM
jgi:hypothetical protein